MQMRVHPTMFFLASNVCRRTGMKVVVRMQAGLHLVRPGFDSRRRFSGVVYVLPSLSHYFFAANAGGTTAFNARGRGFESRRSQDRSSVVEHDCFADSCRCFFVFGHAGTEGSATAKNVVIAGSPGSTGCGGKVGRRARLRMQVLAPMTGLSLARVSNRRLGHRTQTPWSPY